MGREKNKKNDEYGEWDTIDANENKASVLFPRFFSNKYNRQKTLTITFLLALSTAGIFVASGGLSLLPATVVAMLTLPFVGPYLLGVLAMGAVVLAAGVLVNGINRGLNALYNSEWMEKHPTVGNVLRFGIIPSLIVAAALFVLFPPAIPALVLAGPVVGMINLTGMIALTSAMMEGSHMAVNRVLGRGKNASEEPALDRPKFSQLTIHMSAQEKEKKNRIINSTECPVYLNKRTGSFHKFDFETIDRQAARFMNENVEDIEKVPVPYQYK